MNQCVCFNANLHPSLFFLRWLFDCLLSHLHAEIDSICWWQIVNSRTSPSNICLFFVVSKHIQNLQGKVNWYFYLHLFLFLFWHHSRKCSKIIIIFSVSSREYNLFNCILLWLLVCLWKIRLTFFYW